MLCTSCGETNSETAKFCGECGASLDRRPTTPLEERKVVSILFVDLVGFTARSDNADPEDVRATVAPYHAMLRREIERFGGTVEKFIGDAVMAVFGAPTAHEDDPERAVRAALRTIEGIDELNQGDPGLRLAVRAAVNTGEALVDRSARPELGEGIVTGDVVNTASRLQGVAPVGRVVVGEGTFRATRDAIDFEELQAVTLKGKAEPVALWVAIGARSRAAVEVERPRTALIGREDEVEILHRTYRRVVREPSVQLVTITGEPGVGKSRLVAEFFDFVDEQHELVAWRLGRCLSYGEGITFWALGEIVKAEAGILESDGPEDAELKLERSVAERVEQGSQQNWVLGRLAPLVGGSPGGASEQQETFAAWRTYLEGIATARPLVLVVEDLHWADPALIEFLEYLVDWAAQVPLLVLCTARPELYERHPTWAGGKRNATTISLAPLDRDETARLISSLLDQAVLPAEAQAALLERAGGNPLYAEEFVRMLIDRGQLQRHGQVWSLVSDTEFQYPETIQALIAARLDTLAADRKELLSDASVVGKVFWSGALVSMGERDERSVLDGLHELSRKDLIRPARLSSVEGDSEYSFWHLLVRDVAYGQIPRGKRLEKHLAAAAWIEGFSGERIADHAEVLAYHYAEALDLARARDDADVRDMQDRSRRFLLLAADRAMGLDAGKAMEFVRRALDLTPPDAADRSLVLVRLGDAAHRAGSLEEAQGAYEESIRGSQAGGVETALGPAMIGLTRVLWARGQMVSARETLAEATRLMERQPAGPALVDCYVENASLSVMSGSYEDARGWADRALDLAETQDAPDQRIAALGYRALAFNILGLEGGAADLRAALRTALERGLGQETAVIYNNLGETLKFSSGCTESLDVLREGCTFAESRGLGFAALFLRGSSLDLLLDTGSWDEVVSEAEVLIRAGREESQYAVADAVVSKAFVLANRGAANDVGAMTAEALVEARQIGDRQVLAPVVSLAAAIALIRGDRSEAERCVREFAACSGDDGDIYAMKNLPIVLRVCGSIGAVDVARSLLTSTRPTMERLRLCVATSEAMIAEIEGDFDGSARLFSEVLDGWDAFGSVFELAHAHFGAGRSRIRTGDPQGQVSLRRARELFASFGATVTVAEIDGWSTGSAASSS